MSDRNVTTDPDEAPRRGVPAIPAVLELPALIVVIAICSAAFLTAILWGLSR